MYVKLFSSIYQGTLRGRTNELLVFTNLLAHADRYGVVDMHWNAISEETGLPKEAVLEAIKNLEAPDPESRSPDEQGRRITRMDEHRAWGWHVVNYAKYRAIKNEDDRREQNRIAQEKWRSKQRKPPSAHAEAEAKADTKAKKTLSAGADFDAFWNLYPRKEAKAKAKSAWSRLNGELPPPNDLFRIMGEQVRVGCLRPVVVDGRSTVPLPASWLNGKRWQDEISGVMPITNHVSLTRVPSCCDCQEPSVSAFNGSAYCRKHLEWHQELGR